VTAATSVVPRVSTYPGNHHRWIRDRAGALDLVLIRRGAPLEVRWRVIPYAIAQWWRESGEGEHEWNYNVGNIKATGDVDEPGTRGWHGAAMFLHNATDGTQLYRSYDSLIDGVDDWVQLQERNWRYSGPWRGALTGEPAAWWYSWILHNGYSPFTAAAVREYASLYTRARGRTGY
jgi:hypothetical protein